MRGEGGSGGPGTEIKLYTWMQGCYNGRKAFHGRSKETQRQCIRKRGGCMSEKEMLKISVEEFSRLQDYMVDSDKESPAYKKMKRRYIELKVILTASGINLTELDYIKE